MRLRVGIVALSLAIVAGGCGGGDEEPAAEPAAPVETTASSVPSPTVVEDASAEPSAAVSEARIQQAATTAEIDPNADAPDPTTYQQRFDASVEVIYVVYRLEEGVGGDVLVTWTRDGTTVNESTRTLPSDGGWAYEGYPAPTGGYDPGQYEITLQVVGGGDPTLLQFEVE